VNWKKHGIIPAQIITMFEINHWNYGAIVSCNDTIINSAGRYALCYMVMQSIEDKVEDEEVSFRAHPSSLLVKCAEIMYDPATKLPKIGIVDLESLSSTCISIPYDISGENDKFNYMFLEPREKWTDIFIKFLKDEISI